MLTLQQILNSQSVLLEGKRVKLVRHRDENMDYHRDVLTDRNKALEYQKKQARDVFSDCDYIVSFFALERGRSIFFGVFKVSGAAINDQGRFYYSLEQVQEFDGLVDRLIVDWGAGARAWVQWYDRKGAEKEVIEILPAGYIGNFPGLFNFTLEFNELKTLVENPEANHDWRYHLSVVNGVYLILDGLTGQQYVGSAYGENGIWGRWSYYAATAHGGNKELIDLMKEDRAYCRHFRFSVLQTLPSNIASRDVIAIEQLYKKKLGSRIHGLNSN